MCENRNLYQAPRKKRKIDHDYKSNTPILVFQENHQRKFMKNQNSLENKINSIVAKFNNDINNLTGTIVELKKENNGLIKENKYLMGRVSNNSLSIHELRKEMTSLYLSVNNLQSEPENCPYIN